MLADMNIPWVILGHSERRQYYGESSDLVAEKVGVCLGKGLKVGNNSLKWDGYYISWLLIYCFSKINN